jgi:hypothetical protein
MCSKAHPRVKALFVYYDGLVLTPLNDMEILAHILNGRIEDVTIEMSNPLMEGKFVLMFQVKGAQNFIPLQTAHKVLIDPQITTFNPFNRFHCMRD